MIAPRLVELCFQTAGLWELGVQGRLGLPQHVRRVNLYCVPDPAQGSLFAVITPDPEHGIFDADVLDATGKRYLRVSGYSTIALPSAVEPERLKPLQATMSLEAVMV